MGDMRNMVTGADSSRVLRVSTPKYQATDKHDTPPSHFKLPDLPHSERSLYQLCHRGGIVKANSQAEQYVLYPINKYYKSNYGRNSGQCIGYRAMCRRLIRVSE